MSVIEEQLGSLFDDGTIETAEALNERFLKLNSSNYSCLVEAAKVVYEANPAANQKKAFEMFTNIDPKSFKEDSFNLQVGFNVFVYWG